MEKEQSRRWTDERLDDLTSRMVEGFGRLDADMRAVNQRIDAMQRTMVLGLGAILASMVGATFSIILTLG